MVVGGSGRFSKIPIPKVKIQDSLSGESRNFLVKKSRIFIFYHKKNRKKSVVFRLIYLVKKMGIGVFRDSVFWPGGGGGGGGVPLVE